MLTSHDAAYILLISQVLMSVTLDCHSSVNLSLCTEL